MTSWGGRGEAPRASPQVLGTGSNLKLLSSLERSLSRLRWLSEAALPTPRLPASEACCSAGRCESCRFLSVWADGVCYLPSQVFLSHTLIFPCVTSCLLLFPASECSMSELHAFMKHWVLWGNRLIQHWLSLDSVSSLNNSAQGCLSLQSADKSLIEFLNAKGLGCKISQYLQCIQRRQEMAFEESS